MEVTEADKAQVEATQDVSRFLEDPEGVAHFQCASVFASCICRSVFGIAEDA